MTTSDKCEAIIRKVLELANEDKKVTFERDWGGNSITLFINNSHTHVGYDEGTFENFVDQLHNSLHGGPGLSWADTDNHNQAVS